MKEEQMIHAWVYEVWENSKEIDPENHEDWYSLALGFFKGKGCSIKEAIKLATFIRYETPYG